MAKPVAKASPATKLHAARRQPNINLRFQFIVIFCYNMYARRISTGLVLVRQLFFLKKFTPELGAN
jgi:hypothetical protein